MIVPEAGALARVRSAMPSLGPSEAKVAAVILARPEEVVEWSTAELAGIASTSTATVIRACQSLGFRGFQHLRLELARSVPAAVRESDDIVSATFVDAVDAIRLAQESVDPEAVERLADALRGARRLVLVGNGFSGPPVQDFAMRLSTLGRFAEAPIDPLAQQFAVHSLGPDDLCFAVSYSGANALTNRACSTARTRGAGVAVVTSFARSPLGRAADHVIATGATNRAHGVDPYLARLGHLVALHALHSALATRPMGEEQLSMRDVVADVLAEE